MGARTVKSNKTDAVMRLLTGKKSAANPILDNGFKQQKITSRSTRAASEGTEIDITGELVAELLPRVMNRFRCCKCGACYAEAMTEALDTAPTLRVRIKTKDDVKRAEKMKLQSRREVLSVLIRLALKRKNMPIHSRSGKGKSRS